MKTHTFIILLLISTAYLILFFNTGCRDWDVGPEPPQVNKWQFTDINIETYSGSKAKLSWNGYSTSPFITVIGFEIFRKTDSASFNRIAETDADVRSYFDTDLNTELNDYTYYVVAITDSESFSSPLIRYTFACGYDTYTDTRDGSTYKTMSDGYRCWFTENLKFMPVVYPPEDFSTDSARYYVYGYNGSNINQARTHHNYQNYGVLYNFMALQNACPAEGGWHAATHDDWRTLINVLGGDMEAGGALRETDTTHWKHPNTGATNELGFTALPGGKLDSIGGFSEIREAAHFWGSSAGAYSIFHNGTGIFTSHNATDQANSIRCIREID